MKNIKLLTFFVIFSILLTSCNDNDDNITPAFTKTLRVSVNNSDFHISDVQDGYLISGNTNCGSIYIFATLESDEKSYKLGFELLKNGELKRLKCWEKPKSPGLFKLYLTPDFEPKSSVEITDYRYDPANNDISFNFNGTLYLEDKVNTSDTKEISGSIEINAFKSIDCSITYLQNIAFNTSDFQFNTIYSSRSKYKNYSFTNHKFISNNGYVLNLIPENDLWEMPIGTYNFDVVSSTNKVYLKKYIGNLVATQLQTYKEEDWELLDTSGYFTIDNKEQSGSDKNISGTINMNVSLNNQPLFNISNMKYNTASVE